MNYYINITLPYIAIVFLEVLSVQRLSAIKLLWRVTTKYYKNVKHSKIKVYNVTWKTVKSSDHFQRK